MLGCCHVNQWCTGNENLAVLRWMCMESIMMLYGWASVDNLHEEAESGFSRHAGKLFQV